MMAANDQYVATAAPQTSGGSTYEPRVMEGAQVPFSAKILLSRILRTCVGSCDGLDANAESSFIYAADRVIESWRHQLGVILHHDYDEVRYEGRRASVTAASAASRARAVARLRRKATKRLVLLGRELLQRSRAPQWDAPNGD
eukprot:GHVU01175294.1.p1 GENE.GHVU01175294.1~~GHVU01175294.1.p1  ORF type:complete len:143 (+),score=9.39 GHVU01175294.1:233-661(+)